MSQGFLTYKEKIQYLFARMDAGEKILAVELDLLKAYCDGLSREVEQNGDGLVHLFPLDIKSIGVPAKREEPLVEEDVSHLEKEKTVEPTVIEEEIVVEEEKEAPLEIDLEKNIEEEIEKEAEISQSEEVIEEDFFEVKITNDKEEEVQLSDLSKKQVEAEAEATDVKVEEEEQEKEVLEEVVEETTEEIVEADETVEVPETVQDAAPTDEKDYDSLIKREDVGFSEKREPEEKEDYGIGLRFKQSRPLGELIDLSEKYIFIQGLFNQDPDRFTKALRKMDAAENNSEALSILNDYIVADADLELLQKLKAYLSIRFS